MLFTSDLLMDSHTFSLRAAWQLEYKPVVGLCYASLGVGLAGVPQMRCIHFWMLATMQTIRCIFHYHVLGSLHLTMLYFTLSSVAFLIGAFGIGPSLWQKSIVEQRRVMTQTIEYSDKLC